MAVYTVGAGGTFATVAAAMASLSPAVAPGDTLQFVSGYTGEIAAVTINNLIFIGDATNTGITLNLAPGITTATLQGTAPINVSDGLNTVINGNDGDNVVTLTGGG